MPDLPSVDSLALSRVPGHPLARTLAKALPRTSCHRPECAAYSINVTI